MENQIINELNILRAKHHGRNVWLKILGVISAIVIFLTTYMLIMPAITLSGILVCDKTEHTHSADCYVSKKYLSCNNGVTEEETQADSEEEENPTEAPAQEETTKRHIHTKDCYSYKEELICDVEEHTHVISCYKDETIGETAVRRKANARANTSAATYPQDETLIASGDMTADVHWAVTENSFGERTLTIYGNGPMPNYSSTTSMPYYDYMIKQSPVTTKLVIADGVTSIGQRCFCSCKFTDIKIGNTVAVIETQAFSSAQCKNTTLVIPGNVKEIKYAFPWGSWNKIILEEGVEVISDHGLQEVSFTDNSSLHIPASLRSFNPGSPGVLNFDVAEDSDYFYTIDGILYSKEDDALVAFPRERTGSYTISDTCTKIYPNAFFGCKLSELYVPSNVTYPIQTQTFKSSSLTKIHFSEGNTISNSAVDVFDLCYYLTEIDAPDSFWPQTLGSQLMRSTNSLQAFYIGSQVKTVGSAMLTGTTSLKDVYYNAENCTSIPKVLWEYTYGSSVNPRYTLTIGKDVDVLNGTTYNKNNAVLQWGFKSFLYRATDVVFDGPNFIHVNNDVFSECDEPLKSLDNKDIYIDEYGAVYVLDSDGTASLVYVSSTATSLVVPASITDESGDTYTVNKIAGYSCSGAENLTEITFANPGNITEISDYAFYKATELTLINGEHYYADIDALFTNAVLGSDRYNKTALENDPDNPVTVQGDPSTGTQTEDDIWVSVGSSEDAKLYVTTDKYNLLTGANAATTITISNPDSSAMANKIFRIYFHSDSEGIISDKTQDFTLKNEGEATGIPVKVVQADVPGTYYFEIYGYQMGSRTLSTTVGHTFPSPDTDGGNLYIWIETYEVNGVTNSEFPTWVADENNWPQGNVKDDLSDVTYQKITWSTSESAPTIEKVGNTGKITASSIPGAAQYESLKYTTKLGFNSRNISSGEDNYGLDIIKYIVYTDTLILDNNYYINPDIAAAVNSGNYGCGYTGTAGNELAIYTIINNEKVNVVTVKLSKTAFTISKVTLSVDEDGNLVTQFRYNHNNSTSSNGKLAEIPTTDAIFTYGNNVILIDNSDISPTTNYSITNNISIDPVYTYTKEKHLAQDDATVTSKTSTADVVFIMSRNNTISYFGESDVVAISLSNTTPFDYPNAERITLPLPDAYYIKPDDIEKMFNENGNDILSLTIDNASFTDFYGKSVTTSEGTEVIRISPDDTVTDGDPFKIANSLRDDIGTINFKKENGRIKMTVTKTGGEPAVYTIGDPGFETIKDALTSVGYYVTAEAVYSAVYDYGNITIPGGFNEQYKVYITAKDSFKLLGTDRPVKYILDSYTAANLNGFFSKHRNDENYVWGTSTKNYGLGSLTIKREISITESLKIEGVEFVDGGQISDGDILDYQIKVVHGSRGIYDTLPVVKSLSGAQVLLVPYAENANAPWVTDDIESEYIDGELYYILNEPGSYKGVWIDGRYADEVTVTDAGDSGLNTVIKWYFDDIGGNFGEYINVKTICSNSLSGCKNATYSVGSLAWLNDHDGQRLYVSHNGGGSIFFFDKNIVEEKGSSPYQDSLDEDKKTIIYKNNVVTYRLEIENRGNNQTSSIVHGSDIFDQLPNNKEIFSWGTADNTVTVTYFCEGNISVSDETENGWSIQDVPNSNYETKTGLQYLVWDEDFYIEFPEGSANKTCFIYVTLTFPSDDEVWEDYVIANNGADVYNIFYLYNMPSNVIHEVADTGKALLQKGVVNISTRASDSGGNFLESTSEVKRHETRTRYENTDNNVKVVTYYTVVANTSRIKLYLNDIYDSLPVGFEYQGLSFCTDISWGSSNFYKNVFQANIEEQYSGKTKLVTLSNSQDDSYNYNYINCNVSVDKGELSEGERQLLKFTLSGGNLKYDEAMGQYYLNPGEAVRFGYMVTTGFYDSNDGDIATNYIAMPYTDYLGSGVVKDIDTLTHVADVPDVSSQPEANDGTREIWENGYCESLGFDDENAFTQWLGSSVTVERGQIIPGITKQVVSVTNTSGNTTEYTGMTTPTNTVNWQVKLYNDGENAINKYVFTDTMDYPYKFTGKFNITIYNGTTVKTSSTAASTEECLFTFIRNDENNVQVRVNRQSGGPYGNGVYDLTFGVPLKLNNIYVNITSVGSYGINPTVLLEQIDTGKTTANGKPIYNEKLTVYFEDNSGGNLYYLASDGVAVVDFSTKSYSTDYTNTSYVNHAEFIPLEQNFDGRYVSRGYDDYTGVTPFDGQYHMVKNSAVININDGYSTSATKSITETLEPSNTASDLEIDNWILINNEDREFTYTLSVNSPETIVEYIEIIDNLPFVGDNKAYADSSERGSEFKVKLSPTPDFRVKVTSKDGVEKWLNASQFTVDYSTKSGNFSMDDKQHISGWNATADEARSIRVYINNTSDNDSYLINKGEIVTVYFDCKAEEGSQPGAIAWNNFGYTYKAAGSVLSAQTEIVGVKFPGIPTIEKQLLDVDGDPYSADESETFTAVVFEADKSNPVNLSNKTPQQIDALLDSLNCKYTIITLDVEKGNSVSDTTALKEMKCFDYDSETDSFTETDNPFNWVHGNYYGYYELISDSSNYVIHSYSNNGEKRSVFYYNETKKNFLTLCNTRKSASVVLVKTDTDDLTVRLPGAVFALYSPVEADAMTDDEITAAFSEYELTAMPKQTEQMDDTIYYLCDISDTDDSGLINYSMLIRSDYLVSEIKEPDGYYINPEIKHLDTDTPFSQQSIVVEDRASYELPSTGGEGVILLYAVGFFIFAAALIMFGKNVYIKRKEENQ